MLRHFHMLLCHLYIFFGEVSVHVFCSLLIGFSYCWNFKSSLYIVNKSYLSDMCFANVFSHSVLVFSFLKVSFTASLVAQWLRIHLPMQGIQVRALVREDPTCRGATKPVRHNYWAHMLQLLKPVCLEPVLCNKRNHRNEKPTHRNEEWPPLTATRESPRVATKTQCSQK